MCNYFVVNRLVHVKFFVRGLLSLPLSWNTFSQMAKVSVCFQLDIQENSSSNFKKDLVNYWWIFVMNHCIFSLRIESQKQGVVDKENPRVKVKTKKLAA